VVLIGRHAVDLTEISFPEQSGGRADAESRARQRSGEGVSRVSAPGEHEQRDDESAAKSGAGAQRRIEQSRTKLADGVNRGRDAKYCLFPVGFCGGHGAGLASPRHGASKHSATSAARSDSIEKENTHSLEETGRTPGVQQYIRAGQNKCRIREYRSHSGRNVHGADQTRDLVDAE